MLHNIDDALSWLRDVWEPRDVPRTLHRTRLVSDRDALGGPEMTAAFLHFISANADDTKVDLLEQRCPRESCRGAACARCAGTGRYMTKFRSWRYPVWHALLRLNRQPGQRWGPLQRRWWHPTPAEVILTIVAYGCDWTRCRLQYADGQLIPREMAEVFALSAIRKFRASYDRGTEAVVPWTDLSEAQQRALTEPAA